MNPKRNRWLRFGLPVLVTVIVLFLFFRGTDPAKIVTAFASLTWRSLLLFASLSLFGAWLRMQRFSLLLSGKLERKNLFLITLVYNFSVDLLPARTAALGFYAYFTHREGVAWEDGAASFVSAILYDVIAVAVLLLPALFLIGGAGVDPLILAAALVILILLGWAFLYFTPPLLAAAKRRLHANHARIAGMAGKAAAYFLRHKKGKEQLLLLGLSFLIKLVKYLSIYVLIVPLIPPVPPLASFFTFSFGVAAAEVSAYMPIQGIAGLGTWEAAFSFAVSRLGLPIRDPFTIALVVHLTTQVWEYSIGLLAFIFLALRKKRTRG